VRFDASAICWVSLGLLGCWGSCWGIVADVTNFIYGLFRSGPARNGGRIDGQTSPQNGDGGPVNHNSLPFSFTTHHRPQNPIFTLNSNVNRHLNTPLGGESTVTQYGHDGETPVKRTFVAGRRTATIRLRGPFRYQSKINGTMAPKAEGDGSRPGTVGARLTEADRAPSLLPGASTSPPAFPQTQRGT
jgi:hypothetical protein